MLKRDMKISDGCSRKSTPREIYSSAYVKGSSLKRQEIWSAYLSKKGVRELCEYVIYAGLKTSAGIKVGWLD